MTKLSKAQKEQLIAIAMGVVGVIAPFNFPLILSIRSVAPALALGNAGHQAHGLAEGQAARGRRPLHALKALEQLRQLLAVNLDPAAAQKLQPIGTGQQRADFGGAQPLIA